MDNTIYPKKVKNPTGQCYCCKKIKECITIDGKNVCDSCNHLKVKNEQCEFDLCDNCKFYISNNKSCKKHGNTEPHNTCEDFNCIVCNHLTSKNEKNN